MADSKQKTEINRIHFSLSCSKAAGDAARIPLPPGALLLLGPGKAGRPALSLPGQLRKCCSGRRNPKIKQKTSAENTPAPTILFGGGSLGRGGENVGLCLTGVL